MQFVSGELRALGFEKGSGTGLSVSPDFVREDRLNPFPKI